MEITEASVRALVEQVLTSLDGKILRGAAESIGVAAGVGAKKGVFPDIDLNPIDEDIYVWKPGGRWWQPCAPPCRRTSILWPIWPFRKPEWAGGRTRC